MAVLLGLAVAAAYGAADFLGGLSSKASSTTAVVVFSQAGGLVLLAALVVALPEQDPDRRDLLLGLGAGTASCAGVSLLYAGLALGRMSLVAPVTGVGAAVVPFAWGVGGGERPSAVALAGAVIALAGVALVSRTPSGDGVPGPGGEEVAAEGGRPAHGAAHGGDAVPAAGPGDDAPVLGLAVGAGVAFGAVFILLGETDAGAGLWPLLTGRVALVTLVALAGVVVLARGGSLRLAPGSLGLVAATGGLDVAANVLYLVAVRTGLLSLVAVLSSLYPAATVVLARLVLGERLSPAQRVGLALAGPGVVLIAAG